MPLELKPSREPRISQDERSFDLSFLQRIVSIFFKHDVIVQFSKLLEMNRANHRRFRNFIIGLLFSIALYYLSERNWIVLITSDGQNLIVE